MINGQLIDKYVIISYEGNTVVGMVNSSSILFFNTEEEAKQVAKYMFVGDAYLIAKVTYD